MGEKIIVCGNLSVLSNPLTKQLTQCGYDVVNISSDDLQTPAPILAQKFEGTSAVLNLIGTPYFAKWSDRYVHDIYCSRMLAIRAILETIRCCQNGPKTFLHISNAMVYDQYEVHDEFSSLFSKSFIAEVGLMETKEILKATKKLPDVRLIIARSGYLMSNNGGLFPILEKVCRNGIGAKIGDGYQCLPIIHIDDAVRAIIKLISDNSYSGIFNITIPQMASLRELSAAFERHGKRQRIKLPDFLVRLFAGPAITLLEQNCKVIPRRLDNSGFSFNYPTVDDIVKNLY